MNAVYMKSINQRGHELEVLEGLYYEVTDVICN